MSRLQHCHRCPRRTVADHVSRCDGVRECADVCREGTCPQGIFSVPEAEAAKEPASPCGSCGERNWRDPRASPDDIERFLSE